MYSYFFGDVTVVVVDEESTNSSVAFERKISFYKGKLRNNCIADMLVSYLYDNNGKLYEEISDCTIQNHKYVEEVFMPLWGSEKATALYPNLMLDVTDSLTSPVEALEEYHLEMEELKDSEKTLKTIEKTIEENGMTPELKKKLKEKRKSIESSKELIEEHYCEAIPRLFLMFAKIAKNVSDIHPISREVAKVYGNDNVILTTLQKSNIFAGYGDFLYTTVVKGYKLPITSYEQADKNILAHYLTEAQKLARWGEDSDTIRHDSSVLTGYALAKVEDLERLPNKQKDVFSYLCLAAGY